MKKMLLTALLAISLPQLALANPAFSRQTGASCRVCHSQDFHSLNKYGREFLINGSRETEKMKKHRRKLEKKLHGKKPHRRRQMVDIQQIKSDWHARGFSCDLWIDPPGRCWENFVHDTDELIIVLEGRMEFEIEGQAHHPRIGEELLIPAGAAHSARNIGTATSRWLYGYGAVKS